MMLTTYQPHHGSLPQQMPSALISCYLNKPACYKMKLTWQPLLKQVFPPSFLQYEKNIELRSHLPCQYFWARCLKST
eukprot:12891332-Prorocentrum_lima.AAC.1